MSTYHSALLGQVWLHRINKQLISAGYGLYLPPFTESRFRPTCTVSDDQLWICLVHKTNSSMARKCLISTCRYGPILCSNEQYPISSDTWALSNSRLDLRLKKNLCNVAVAWRCQTIRNRAASCMLRYRVHIRRKCNNILTLHIMCNITSTVYCGSALLLPFGT